MLRYQKRGRQNNRARQRISGMDSVRRTSNHSQQRLLREEVLSLTQENAQSTGILRIDLRFRRAESWRLV